MMSTKSKMHPKKGIMKPKELGKNIVKIKSTDSTEVDVAENVLTFPLLKTMDRDRMLPRYSAVLNRVPEEGVVMDDLDALQLELEALLSAVVVRSRVLRKEILVLSDAEEKRDKKSKVFKSPLPPGKRGLMQDKPVKKLKDTSSKLRELGKSPLPIKFTQVKSIPHTITSSPNICVEQEPVDTALKVQAPKILQPRYDVPNRFWASVDPYCTDITSYDVRFVEELVREYDNDTELQKVPTLGPHYSLCWAQEELVNEQDKSHTDSRNRNKPPSSPTGSQVLLKRAEKVTEVPATGPLTQRLVSALMEENINKTTANEKSDAKRCTGGENVTPVLSPIKNFSGSNSVSFERRVKKELEDQGILESNDQPKDAGDDEILQEIKRCQSELKVITHHNQLHLKRLLKLANIEVVRQDLKKKLKDADNEVMDSYRNVLAIKQKKKALSKAEQELCWKTLKERDAILKQLDTL